MNCFLTYSKDGTEVTGFVSKLKAFQMEKEFHLRSLSIILESHYQQEQN